MMYRHSIESLSCFAQIIATEEILTMDTLCCNIGQIVQKVKRNAA